jgi:hypothetical protein
MRSTWLGVFVAMAGCGPVVGDPPPQGSDDGAHGESSTEGSTTLVVTSNDEGGESSSTGEPVTIMCGAAEPSTRLAVISNETTAAVLRADGLYEAIDLPPSSAPPEVPAYTAFTPRGEWIAALRTWSLFGKGAPDYGAELIVLDASGEQVWSVVEDDTYLSTLYLGDDGSVATQRSDFTGVTEGVLYLGADEELVLPSFVPGGRRRADDWIAGSLIGEGGVYEAGWMSTDLQEQRLRYPVLWSWIPRDDGDYVYLSTGKSVPWLVVDSPAQATFVPIDALATADPSTLTVNWSPGLEWLLVHDGMDGWWRIEVSTGTTDVLDLTPPDGEMMFECYSPSAVIDEAGRVLVGTRDATAAAMHRFDPATSTWESLGERVTNVDDIGANPYGETSVVHTTGSGMTFCPPQMFDPGTAVLGGTTQQLLRPVDGFARVLPANVYPIPDRSGICAALSDYNSLTLLDLAQEIELDLLAGPTSIVWWSP